jgi:O-antigen ligase
MTSTAASTTPAAGPRLELITFALFATFVASLQFSIAAANILLGVTFVCWLTILVRERRRPSAPAFFVALLAYAVATLVSSAFSLDPRESFIDDRQLLLLLIVPLTYDLASRQRWSTITMVIITAGAVSAALGIVQYTLLHYDTLGRRVEGTLSHYMTYSGELMLVICLAASRLVLDRRNRAWPAIVLPALIVAVVLTFTRNAMVGALAATALLLVLRDFRLVALLPVLVAIVFALAPDRITQRMVSIFDLHDPTNRDRVAMMHSGFAIIRDHPITGVGPNMIPRVYVQYRDPNAENATNPHLHNVPLQIAAERGLLALGAWLWFVVATVAGLARFIRQKRVVTPAGAALAAMVAMLTAGLFEHNFGDSEFLMLFLVIITLPFAAARPSA